MSSTLAACDAAAAKPSIRAAIDMKLEVVVIPVSDVERAKRFYGVTLGWRLDADITRGEAFRVLQFTPPGSHCSVHFGIGVTTAEPGSAQATYLAVADIEGARAELVARGVEVGPVFHRTPAEPHASGREPTGRTYASFASFSDPDGNSWLLQEITARLPGRVNTTQVAFSSAGSLAAALFRAEAAHGAYEKRIGHRHADWPAWYSAYLFAEQLGTDMPA